MTYETKVKLTETSSIINESLSQLTSDEWADWIGDTIHHKSRVFVAGQKGDYSSTSIFDVIQKLSPPTRANAYQGIETCLDEAYQNRISNNFEYWTDEALDDLLLLINYVEWKDEEDISIHQDKYFIDRTNKIQILLGILQPTTEGQLFDDHVDVYFRALQMLVGIESKCTFNFWLENLQKSPRLYGSVCFDGALNNSPYDAIKLLPYIKLNGDITEAMKNSLIDFFCDYRNSPEVIEAMERQKNNLPKKMAGIIERAKREMDKLLL